jgi:hypothetical protein
MTYVYSRQTTTTAGSLDGITKFLTVLGSGVHGVVKGFTQGKVDEDTLLIKASTTENDLTETEAMDLIDSIRKDLPINKIKS